ncbi:LAQU0S10e02344g1_1 [Lachancea quebecensis]|uniref:LAQU0S10e02344g1_1 n=1 Tax=Lachancea quebecensis TaxID=1654605 RepID=A0A0P1KUB7_9SACH|nr:LAQU0S10e02344g1_1 [Lachancea quebecensis]
MEEAFLQDCKTLRRVAAVLKEKSHRLQDAEKVELARLEHVICDNLRAIERILEPKSSSMEISRVLNDPECTVTPLVSFIPKYPRPGFKRTFFYSPEAPYTRMRDKSGSFRIAPPAPMQDRVFAKRSVHSSVSKDPQIQHSVSINFLLQNLALIENLRNLQRLGQGP